MRSLTCCTCCGAVCRRHDRRQTYRRYVLADGRALCERCWHTAKYWRTLYGVPTMPVITAPQYRGCQMTDDRARELVLAVLISD